MSKVEFQRSISNRDWNIYSCTATTNHGEQPRWQFFIANLYPGMAWRDDLNNKNRRRIEQEVQDEESSPQTDLQGFGYRLNAL
ncbi:hypothetical protein D3C86_1708700 [compost metagenome]